VGTTDVALDLIRRARTAEQIRAALEAAAPGERLHQVVVDRFDELARSPRRDPTGALRAQLLRALRPMITVADRSRAETALLTYEFGFGPQGENCAGLRAAGLLALADLDPDAAESYAVRLLGDAEHTEPMSGEPALTAVRYLAARGSTAPIYLYALAGGTQEECLAEALRALSTLPAPLVRQLAERLSQSDDDIALVGLFDLLTTHAEPAAFAGFVRDWALKTSRFEVLNFAAAQILASRLEPLLQALREAAALSGDERRKALLSGVLGPADPAARGPDARSRPGSA